MTTQTKNHILSAVAGATTVDAFLLMEDEDFLERMDNMDMEIDELISHLIDWVNENY